MKNPDYDKAFHRLAKYLICKYDLDREDRSGIYFTQRSNIGDIYFFLSALKPVIQFHQKTLYIFYESLSTIHRLSGFFDLDDANIVFIKLKCKMSLISSKASNSARRNYKNMLEHFHWAVDGKLFNRSSPQEIKERLSRAHFPQIDRDKYIVDLDIVPGKTIFVIPKSIWAGELPTYFWKICIEIFLTLGFKVIVNSAKKGEYGPNVTYALPPIEDIVGLSDLCGYVFAMRCGLSEVIAAESKAQMTIINYDTDLFKWYPFIDNSNGRIKFKSISNIRTSGFNELDRYLSDYFKILRDNAYHALQYNENYHSISATAVYKKPQIVSCRNSNNLSYAAEHYFSWCQIPDFCNVRYNLDINGRIVILYIYINPPLEYKIYFAIKSKNNHVIKEIWNHTFNPLIFKIDHPGTYRIFVKIFDPLNTSYCQFSTSEFTIKGDVFAEIRSCIDYAKYIDLLYHRKDNLLIFMASKDAHTNINGSKNLFFDKLGIDKKYESEYRASFIAVIDEGEPVFHESSPNKEVTAYVNWDGNTARIISNGYNVLNSPCAPVSIMINGNEEAINTRGINFVVWDKIANAIIDSVAFDTFGALLAVRKNPFFNNPFLFDT